MPYNVLLLPLIGGYYFLSNFVFFRYKFQRVSSQRLILNAALAGVFVSIFSITIARIFEKILPKTYINISEVLSILVHESEDYLWTMLFGLILVILLTHLLNLLISVIPRFNNVPIRRAIRNYGNELEQLCLDSIIEGFALQVTLKNDKVYVGFINEAPIPSKTNYLLFTPLYSGFRHPTTKILELNTSYSPVIESLIADNLAEKRSIMNLVLKQDEILTLSPHDPDVFSRFAKQL